ncbi:hypothetical protein [Kosakonia phage Kc304]|uniref:Uncharacterized protein n=2 Tax=Winklervirus chi14 TaxID=2560752 RepID=A0A1Z1LY29_9CAUD|nr:hypothetical protein FDI23_gp015 [Serratia phage CHI14]ARW57438.1 hypothetical protein [Serratia phage CHI14]ARW57713.1 hypothetical protein [Serratia phage CBH8]QYN80461.1 hypothetical protein [Kosakonia phage Kc304]UJJ21999.1 hypothetical protein [Erwinia phage Virsaitis27]
MYGMTEEHLDDLIKSIKIQLDSAEHPALLIGWELIEELEAIKAKADAIIWFTGFAPDFYISDHVANLVLQFKVATDD